MVLLPLTGAGRTACDVITSACLQWEVPHLMAPAGVVVTEFVRESVLRASTMMDLHIVLGRRYLLVQLFDGGQRASEMSPLSAVLIEELVARWGYLRQEGRTVTWAALRLTGPPCPAPRR
ncbi:hypothetical protein [Actinoplanes couchii]|uniref:hypothetical protein n=1 Tax=Actinoplanes couchii TaxID=403638 RepID=UPI001944F369|nr:hypothetical protein [Actinoplanes couchii]MDR6324538.1 hypothetical protein [Actinoplanes couchii]